MLQFSVELNAIDIFTSWPQKRKKMTQLNSASFPKTQQTFVYSKVAKTWQIGFETWQWLTFSVGIVKAWDSPLMTDEWWWIWWTCFAISVADPDPPEPDPEPEGSETLGRIRIRSGSQINILDPDSNPDSNLESNPDSNPDPKPDPKQICKKEPYF